MDCPPGGLIAVNRIPTFPSMDRVASAARSVGRAENGARDKRFFLAPFSAHPTLPREKGDYYQSSLMQNKKSRVVTEAERS